VERYDEQSLVVVRDEIKGDVLVFNLRVIWLTLSISSWYVSMVL
jgi:hypothetical protein